MTFVILVITILTLVFGVIAYFLYKVRESKRNIKKNKKSYEEVLLEEKSDFLFFKQE